MALRIRRIVLILLAAAALGLAWNALSGRGFALAPQRLPGRGGRAGRRRGGARPPRQGRALPRRAAGRLLRDEPHPGRAAPPGGRLRPRASPRSSRACARRSTSSCTAAGSAARPATSSRASSRSAGSRRWCSAKAGRPGRTRATRPRRARSREVAPPPRRLLARVHRPRRRVRLREPGQDRAPAGFRADHLSLSPGRPHRLSRRRPRQRARGRAALGRAR